MKVGKIVAVAILILSLLINFSLDSFYPFNFPAEVSAPAILLTLIAVLIFHKVWLSSNSKAKIWILFALLVIAHIPVFSMLKLAHASTCSKRPLAVQIEGFSSGCGKGGCKNYIDLKSSEFLFGTFRLSADDAGRLSHMNPNIENNFLSCHSKFGVSRY